jgi:hypothetical protein
MSKLMFLVSRNICTHLVRLFVASAALIFLLGLWGPRYGAVLARITVLATQIAPVIGVILSAFIMAIRKRTPGVKWDESVTDYAGWGLLGALERLAYTIFFVLLATFSMCFGALIGVIPVYLAWTLM